MVDGGQVYSFKNVLVVCKRGRGRQFLVDWEGYGPEECSWVPASFIVDCNKAHFFTCAYCTCGYVPMDNNLKGSVIAALCTLFVKVCTVQFAHCVFAQFIQIFKLLYLFNIY